MSMALCAASVNDSSLTSIKVASELGRRIHFWHPAFYKDTVQAFSHSMRLFSNRITRRWTAFAVLVAWSLALISGIAHACPGEAIGEHVHIHADVSSGKTQLAPSAASGPEVSLADGAPLPGSDGCEKVRGDNSQSAIKLQIAWDLTCAMLVPSVAVGWSQSATLVQARNAHGNEKPALVGPPLRIVYSRLAL